MLSLLEAKITAEEKNVNRPFFRFPATPLRVYYRGTKPMIKSLTGRSDFNNRIYQKARFGYSPHEPFPSPPAYRQAGTGERVG
jgi:hypothetical protein